MTRQLELPRPAAVDSRLTDLYRESGLPLDRFLALVREARATGRTIACPAHRWGEHPAPWLRVLAGLVADERDRRD